METLQNKIDRILEQGVAPTVAIVRIGEDEGSKAFEARVQEAGNAFAVAIEKFIFPEISDETAGEQLFCYFVFRHFCPEYEKTSLAFCLLSFLMTEKAAEQIGIFEAARLWSSEIEYSSENKPLLLSTLFEEGV